MQPTKPIRRLTLRELLTDSEKRARQLSEHLTTGWLVRNVDLRELSRPVRRRSHFPAVVSVQHAAQKVLDVSTETASLLDYLRQELEEIRNHAVRERDNPPG
jgi:hypothetical protein